MRRKTITCNQYDGRIYLRPIMPVATRRRSKLAVEVEGQHARGRVDSAGADEGIDKAVKANLRSPRLLEDGRESGEEEIGMMRRGKRRTRTFSMEMNEAIEALNREEEDLEGMFCSDSLV